MKISLHKNATTTPAQRAMIQNSPHLSVSELAGKIGVSRTTIRRWRMRSTVYDRSHAPKHRNRALTPKEELQLVFSRMVTRAGLDDLLGLAGSFLGIHCSRAGLNRCLSRYGISKLSPFSRQVPYDLKDYTGTYLAYTCFYLPGGGGDASPLYVHILTDCFFRTLNLRLCASGHEFLYDQIRAFPLRVLGILYQDPIILTSDPDPAAILRHAAMVEGQCRSHQIIAHRLAPQYPTAVERFKKAHASLAKTGCAPVRLFPWSSNAGIARAVTRYNTRFTLTGLKHQTPQQAMENHYSQFPGSFRQKPRIWAA